MNQDINTQNHHENSIPGSHTVTQVQNNTSTQYNVNSFRNQSFNRYPFVSQVLPSFPNVPLILNNNNQQEKESSIMQRFVTFTRDFFQIGKIGCHLMLGLSHIAYSNFRLTRSDDYFEWYAKTFNFRRTYIGIFNGLSILDMGFDFIFGKELNEDKLKNVSMPLNIFETIFTNSRALMLANVFPENMYTIFGIYGYLHIFFALYTLSKYTLSNNPITNILKQLKHFMPRVSISFS